MNRPHRPIISFAALVVVCSGVASCADQQPTQTDSESPVKTISETGQPMDVDKQASMARQDLAQRLGIDQDQIDVETVRHVQWRSGATGCPEPGKSYSMAIVPGVLILLRSGGQVYRFHARRNGTPFYCPANRAEEPVFGQGAEAM